MSQSVTLNNKWAKVDTSKGDVLVTGSSFKIFYGGSSVPAGDSAGHVVNSPYTIPKDTGAYIKSYLGQTVVTVSELLDGTTAPSAKVVDVKAALVLTTDLPRQMSASATNDATFTTKVEGGTTPIEYKWYWRKDDQSEWVFIDPEADPDNPNTSAATDTLVNHAVSVESAGYYMMTATDKDGDQVSSTPCYLIVYPVTGV